MSDEPEERPAAPPLDIREAVGGPLGMAETALPGVAFVAAYTASGSDTNTAAIVAVGLAVVLTIARLAKRETPVHALSGLVGVGIAAFIATRSGRAEDFFLPGLLANAAYASAFVISIAVKHPLVGVIVANLDGEGSAWRRDPERARAFVLATWLWAGLFGLRLLVQLPLYLTHSVVALGVVKTAMGIPLFVIGIWLTWLIVRRHRTPAAVAEA